MLQRDLYDSGHWENALLKISTLIIGTIYSSAACTDDMTLARDPVRVQHLSCSCIYAHITP
jgi:hypothetical protein